MVALQCGEIVLLPLGEGVSQAKTVDMGLYRTLRESFSAELSLAPSSLRVVRRPVDPEGGFANDRRTAQDRRRNPIGLISSVAEEGPISMADRIVLEVSERLRSSPTTTPRSGTPSTTIWTFSSSTSWPS